MFFCDGSTVYVMVLRYGVMDLSGLGGGYETALRWDQVDSLSRPNWDFSESVYGA